MIEPMRTALTPLAEELVAAAKGDAAQRLAAAEEAVARSAAEARSQVDGLLATARDLAVADAAGAAAAERARGRREARAVVLAAQREAVEDLLAAARESVAGLVKEPNYPRWRDAFAAHARNVLGPHATVHDVADGGVVVVAGPRRMDLSLARFAEQALAELGAQLGLAVEGPVT